MITPNKVVTLEKSALGLLSVILIEGPGQIGLLDLYRRTSNEFENIDQFLLAIDLLYILDRIEINFDTGVLIYAD
jgi:hypothetical protein